MAVELTLPSTPVALAPGVPTRVPVELRNTQPAPLDVRISVARGRASGWASVEPPTTTIGAGATATVDVVLRAPHDQPPSTSLVPFTVHALDAASGVSTGFATGLLTVAVPVPVRGELTPSPGRRNAFDLHLANDGGYPADIRITAKLDPPAGSAEARPPAARLEAHTSLAAVVKAKPSRPLIGTARQYAVVVTVHDGADLDRRPLLTAVGTGTRKPRLPNWAAATIAILLALGATAGVAFSGVRIPLPGRNRTAAPPPVVQTTAAAPVVRPYAMVDVFPHQGADGGKAAAEAQRARFEAAGMPVRMIDSLASDELADDGAGFWVLLKDGFGTPAEAQAFCDQWRSIAPKCFVTS